MNARDGAACCSSPGAMVYCFAVFGAAWGALSVVGFYWHPLHASSSATVLLAAGIACTANWRRSRTFHCAITGPLFLVAGLALLLAGGGILAANVSWVPPAVLAGAAIAFLLEWRYSKRPGSRP